ncbi:MAG: phycobilisome protein [Synechococcus sp. SB0673_bin_10]|uniref:Phycobilisome protein n=1 Tax=Synechococcus sp. SB0676_bin_10 TaxID=2604869 RepID=A0A6B1F9W4_9SYNE|nr:phycobilisome protein [Cyanobacteria bacterium MAG IRC3_bin_20]MDE0646571.1 phycobilisome protein [Cyanobacteria bacterium MAG IRC4_bin_6]MXW12346.1 phycobilisome protein [Synechococcus sp. SB0668_bin_13]MXX09266.1 phycobilisome protein [Synechococcus sp. SB0667_bin_8]MYG37733.1 phycobilisome protein [Synechococcus sp. SB0676_bin_10]MYG63749.1 phycobilisome protein [Synechococcus sp. SB0675_bin_7]MYI71177.1 phycobilisome protein [Synechococcus sp. SB0673_bin_10]MYK07634.1 phycobilisome pr
MNDSKPGSGPPASLSVRALALIPKARILGLPGDPRLSAAQRNIFAEADERRRHLLPHELDHLSGNPHSAARLVGILQPEAEALVARARRQLLEEQPGLIQAGGGLYPPFRAAACWRDLWQFLRCVLYGAASGIVDFTSPRGVQALELLYQELHVPLGAMVRGLELLKQHTITIGPIHQPTGETVVACFDHLIGSLQGFRASQEQEHLT